MDEKLSHLRIRSDDGSAREEYANEYGLHREDGPALIIRDISGNVEEQYWINGQMVEKLPPQAKLLRGSELIPAAVINNIHNAREALADIGQKIDGVAYNVAEIRNSVSLAIRNLRDALKILPRGRGQILPERER